MCKDPHTNLENGRGSPLFNNCFIILVISNRRNELMATQVRPCRLSHNQCVMIMKPVNIGWKRRLKSIWGIHCQVFYIQLMWEMHCRLLTLKYIPMFLSSMSIISGGQNQRWKKMRFVFLHSSNSTSCSPNWYQLALLKTKTVFEIFGGWKLFNGEDMSCKKISMLWYSSLLRV